MLNKSAQRLTAERLVAAFNAMDIDTILSLRTPTCTRHILPSSLNIQPQDNTQYRKHLEQLVPIFSNFELTLQDLLEDREAKRISMWLTARADTAAGEYVNEYMWVLDFENGEGGKANVSKSVEFVDAVVNRDFWPKLREAMKRKQEDGAREQPQ